MFELNYSLTKGGPYGTTTSMALNIYNDAFANNKYGLATAESLIFFLIVLAAAVIQLYFSRRQERRFEA
jgi:raffinose/stachyose/melibiose transport system permease protein